jgi:hypothetical protein
MKLIKEHFSKHLHSFVNEKAGSLNDITSEMQNDYSAELIEIIRYIDQLLNKTFNSTNSDITTLNIHIETEFNDDEKLLIAEFLSIKLFKHYQSSGPQTNETDISILEIVSVIERKQSALKMKCPDGASAKNGGNKIWKNWIKEQDENSALLEFYKKLDKGLSLKPKTLFNTQKYLFNSLSQLFEFKPYCTFINSKNKSYNLLNTSKTLNDIDENNNIIDEIDSVILFDCERKKLMTNFSYEEIIKWNTDYATRFSKYLIITFGKEQTSINHTKNKLDLIRERFKIPSNSTYTIINYEIDILYERQFNSSISVEFDGFESSSFWDEFIKETKRTELYELRSIRMMNLYSVCLSDEIKNYILNDLFSKEDKSELITFNSNTKQAILELRDDDIERVKQALSKSLDVIINSNIKSKIIESLANTQTIIFDDAILKNLQLISKITNCLGLTNSIKLKPWSDLLNLNANYLLILSYRDQGKYPNYYYPNIHEIELDSEKTVNAILPNFLFGHYYDWSKYYLLKEYYKLLTHPIRENHFNWNKFRELIQAQKPESKLVIDWNLENEYSSTENRETYRVKFYNQRAKTYHSSDFVIFSERNSEKPRIERVKWFSENIDFEESKYKIQKLDELLDEFNPAEKLLDTTLQERELDIIRKELGLENVTAGRIWKILLRKKADLIGVDSLFEELKLLFTKNNIPLVKQSYLIDSWLNSESTSLMPRGNKIVKVLFDYLNLSVSYRLILYRLKNASISGKIEATKKYSRLLKDLFEDGCFDKNASLKSILQSRIRYYQNNYSLEELGIDNDAPMLGLTSLIELIQPELKLIELETIEKLSNE